MRYSGIVSRPARRMHSASMRRAGGSARLESRVESTYRRLGARRSSTVDDLPGRCRRNPGSFCEDRHTTASQMTKGHRPHSAGREVLPVARLSMIPWTSDTNSGPFDGHLTRRSNSSWATRTAAASEVDLDLIFSAKQCGQFCVRVDKSSLRADGAPHSLRRSRSSSSRLSGRDS